MLHATSSSSSYASTPSSLPSELNIKSSMRPESMSRYRRITLDSSSELLDRTNSVRFQWVTHACLQQPFNVSDRHAVVEIILESQVKKTLLMLHVLRMDSYKLSPVSYSVAVTRGGTSTNRKAPAAAAKVSTQVCIVSSQWDFLPSFPPR